MSRLSLPDGHVVGVDEVGRGALAGPVVAAAAGFAHGIEPIAGVNDSKQVPRKLREHLVPLIRAQAEYINLGVVPAQSIDQKGIVSAVDLAMTRAVYHCRRDVSIVIDGTRVPDQIGTLFKHSQAVIRGDASVYAIAAASIIAKVWRDRYMKHAAISYPDYGFDQHVGYGTTLHRRAIYFFGLTSLHRLTFCHKIKYSV